MSNQVFRNNIARYTGGSNSYWLNVSQSINTSQNKEVEWDSSVEAFPGFSLATGVFTCLEEGVYSFSVTINFTANATGERQVWFLKGNDNNDKIAMNQFLKNSGTDFTIIGTSTVLRLTKGEIFRVLVYQTTGGALDIVGKATDVDNYCLLNISKIV